MPQICHNAKNEATDEPVFLIELIALFQQFDFKTHWVSQSRSLLLLVQCASR